ncbi:GL22551, partial [Drosophila persimilis]
PVVTYPSKQALTQFESLQKTRPVPPPQQNGPPPRSSLRPIWVAVPMPPTSRWPLKGGPPGASRPRGMNPIMAPGPVPPPSICRKSLRWDPTPDRRECSPQCIRREVSWVINSHHPDIHQHRANGQVRGLAGHDQVHQTDHRNDQCYRERSRSRERERQAQDHYRDESRSARPRKSPEPVVAEAAEAPSSKRYYEDRERYRSSDRERRDRDRDRDRERERDRDRREEHRSRH